MKHKLWLTSLAVLSALCLMLGISACGGSSPSAGLIYYLNEDRASYAVVGIGSCKDSHLVIPSAHNDLPVTSIGGSAFASCIKLKSVVIPDSVTYIGGGAFNYCTGLTKITIPGSVTQIGYEAFLDCKGLKNVTLGSGVTEIGNRAFDGCSKLTSITIPESVTSIEGGAFNRCTGLTSILVEAGNVFYHSDENCLIETTSKTLILGCKNSKIPDDGSVTKIGSDAFYISGLKGELTIPDSVVEIEERAFSGCKELTKITIPDNVTRIEKIAFSGCEGVTSVMIGSGVTRIEDSAFSDCSGLTEIHYNGTIDAWKQVIKGDSWDKNTGIYTVYCTGGSITKSGIETYDSNA